MIHSSAALLPAALRVALLTATVAVPLGGVFAPPAQAQGWGEERRERERYNDRERSWDDRGRRDGYNERARYSEDRGRRESYNERERYWDDGGRREGYYRRPDLYYSAPPVVVHHPDYYRQPSPGISFQLPYFYR
jgi:Ni/Co efflux regulator RcnB